MTPPIDDDVLALIRGSLRSVWTLELLLLLRQDRGREWLEPELVGQLRGSVAIVRNSVAELSAAGLVAADRSRGVAYAPASDMLHEVVERLALAYARTPAAVMKAIVTAPDDRIQIFADAFRVYNK